jgi:hypothetical protein
MPLNLSAGEPSDPRRIQSLQPFPSLYPQHVPPALYPQHAGLGWNVNGAAAHLETCDAGQSELIAQA